MNQKIINVELEVLNGEDVLNFHLDEKKPFEYVVSLNSSSSQNSLKHVFSKLLTMILEEELILELSIQSDYKKGLYKDVCTEYIADLNREITQVKDIIRMKLE